MRRMIMRLIRRSLDPGRGGCLIKITQAFAQHLHPTNASGNNSSVR